MQLEHTDIKKAIIRSQHCQRNWDLAQQMPQEDLDLFIHAVQNCPSKQNVAFYKAHFVTNRDIIESIHKHTAGFKRPEDGVEETNSQTLANLLVIFESVDPSTKNNPNEYVNDELYNIDVSRDVQSDHSLLKRDENMAIGIAAGYLNLLASMLGYGTGCCACFDGAEVSKIVKNENPIALMMGIGFKDSTRNRREHHQTGFMFPTKTKQEIQVNVIK
jgi:hypothetical protein